MRESDLQPGTWVRSIAGSDTDVLYWVLKQEADCCWLVDGKRHRLDHPKRKNKKHIQKLETDVIVLPFVPSELQKQIEPEQRKWEAQIRKASRRIQKKGVNHV